MGIEKDPKLARIVNRLRRRRDLVKLVRENIPTLRAAGRNFKGCCVFHHIPERTPSLVVNRERQVFHCFSCHESGDIFSFVMRLKGLSFEEAVARLARRAGLRLKNMEEP